MPQQPLAIVLGGTNPHIALIDNLKKRGYYTVLVDYYENPPAKAVADEHIRESTLDQEKVLAIARQRAASLVISTCIDQANATACYVAEKLGLPAPYSYLTALNVTNKGLMKEKMLANGIPTAKFNIIANADDPLLSTITFPVVVKPSDCTGSKGVKKANNLTELKEFLSAAFSLSRRHEAIIEEYKSGVEIQIDFFVRNREPREIMIREKSKVPAEIASVLQTIGSIVPVEISPAANQRIHGIANDIVRVFNLDNTALFIQAIVDSDEVYVVEFACRIGGGLSCSMIKVITGFDILDATVDSFLGVVKPIEVNKPTLFYSTTIIYAIPSNFGWIEGHLDLKKEGVIEEFYLFKTQGMKIGPDLSSQNRVAAFLARAESRQVLQTKMDIAIERLQVYDVNSKPIMRKDIYVKDYYNKSKAGL